MRHVENLLTISKLHVDSNNLSGVRCWGLSVSPSVFYPLSAAGFSSTCDETQGNVTEITLKFDWIHHFLSIKEILIVTASLIELNRIKSVTKENFVEIVLMKSSTSKGLRLIKTIPQTLIFPGFSYWSPFDHSKPLISIQQRLSFHQLTLIFAYRIFISVDFFLRVIDKLLRKRKSFFIQKRPIVSVSP